MGRVTIAVLCLTLSAGLLWTQNGNPLQPPGPVGAQAIGRIVLDADGNGEVICYFTVFGNLKNLFAGPRGEAAARITARSTKFRVETTLNGSAVHFRTVPVNGDAILVNFYYDDTPDQDFSRPETFSDGQMFSTWRWHSSLGTLSPSGLTPSVGQVDLVSSSVLFYDGQPFQVKNQGERGTAFFQIVAPPAIGPNLSLPASATFIVAK